MRRTVLILAVAALAMTTPAPAAQPRSRPPRGAGVSKPVAPRPTPGVRPVFPGVRTGGMPGRPVFPGVRPPGGTTGRPVIVPAPEERRRPYGNRPRWSYGPGRWWNLPPWYWPGRYPYDYWRNPHQCPRGNYHPWSMPFSSTSSPYGTDAYAGEEWGGGMEDYSDESYPYPYPTTGYYADMGIYSTSVPYYEADPVQYAYAPTDIPPRAAVVRPSRTSPAALIVPGAARTPLHALATKSNATRVVANGW